MALGDPHGGTGATGTRAQPSRAAPLGVAAAFVLSLIAALLVAALGPSRDGAVAAVFLPGTRAGTAIAAVVQAGGRFQRFGRAPWLAVAIPSVPGDAAFADRLRAHGALMLINPVLAGNCASARSSDQG